MIGIIGAMDKEIELLLNQMTIHTSDIIADKTFFVGNIVGKEVVVVKSGIGKVNATITASILLQKYEIEYVINIGLAGGISPAKIGDIIIAEGISYFDVSLTAIDDVVYGKMGSDPLTVFSDLKLKQKATFIFDDLGVVYHVGHLVSGDQFVVKMESLSEILNIVDNVLACEMEGMAIGITCYKFNIPFISIRGISDVIENSDQTDVYQSVSEKIAHQTSSFVVRFLEAS